MVLQMLICSHFLSIASNYEISITNSFPQTKTGLPRYIVARQIALGGPLATSFQDLKKTHSPQVAYI